MTFQRQHFHPPTTHQVDDIQSPMTERINSGVRNSFRSRACDNCRIRKIRCDKVIPCSSCRTLGISCRGGTPSAEPRLTVPNVPTASNEYEQKIDSLQEQISALQKSIQDLSQNISSKPSPSPSTLPLPLPSTQISASATPAFEGQSSFNNESLLARDAAYSAVATLPHNKVDESVSSALMSLKSSLDQHYPASTQEQVNEAATFGQSDADLPPVGFVVAVVKKIKVQPPFSLVSHSWRDYLQIESLCQKIYFPSEPIAAGSLTLLHGLLYIVIRDYMHEKDSDLPDCESYAALCERRFTAGLKSYEMTVNPTLEKIQALFLGVIKAQEDSNLQQCWSFLSIAFNLCQTMGLHRSSTVKNDPTPIAEAKRHVFWSLYMIDKNLSLNIGLTSHFQDHDIDADFFTPSTDPKQRPWDLMALTIIKFSAIQGRIYDRLYAVSGGKMSSEEKGAAIEVLSGDLVTVRDELLSIDVSTGLYSESLHGMAACADFIAYSVLTVIYRAQTLPSNAMSISTRCLEAATLALQSHLKCFAQFKNRKTHKQAEYVNWILLYPSFTPFIVIFTHAIATTNQSDLTLLQETVQSLHLLKPISRGSSHLYEICRAFLNTAQVLIESQQTLTGLERHDDGSLSLPSALDGQTNIVLPEVQGEFGMNSADISFFLNDFLGANRSVMDLLNEWEG